MRILYAVKFVAIISLRDEQFTGSTQHADSKVDWSDAVQGEYETIGEMNITAELMVATQHPRAAEVADNMSASESPLKASMV